MTLSDQTTEFGIATPVRITARNRFLLSAPKSSERNRRTPMQTSNRHVAAPDRGLKSRVEQRLATLAEGLCERIRVELVDETVILTGTVDSDYERQFVMRIVLQLSEVVSIQDRLQVEYPGRPEPDHEDPEALWTWLLGCWGQRP